MEEKPRINQRRGPQSTNKICRKGTDTKDEPSQRRPEKMEGRCPMNPKKEKHKRVAPRWGPRRRQISENTEDQLRLDAKAGSKTESEFGTGTQVEGQSFINQRDGSGIIP